MKTKSLIILALVAVIVGFVLYKKRDVIMAMFGKKIVPGNNPSTAGTTMQSAATDTKATVSTTGATANPSVIKTTQTQRTLDINPHAIRYNDALQGRINTALLPTGSNMLQPTGAIETGAVASSKNTTGMALRPQRTYQNPFMIGMPAPPKAPVMVNFPIM